MMTDLIEDNKALTMYNTSVSSCVVPPRVDFLSPDGRPIAYCKFIRHFQTYVADRQWAGIQRPLFLLYYFNGKLREAIEACGALLPEAGYEKAFGILNYPFGRPHEAARFLLDLL